MPAADDRGRGKLGDKSNLIAVEEVPAHLTHQYGICGVGKRTGNMSEVDGMVEKPPKGTAPSNLSITGRYILQPEIFKILETQERGAGGEIQLTDAMIGLAKTQSSTASSSKASGTIAARRRVSSAPISPSAWRARICATACARR